MKSKSNFQIIVIVLFLFAGGLGILVFSGIIPIGNKAQEKGGGGTVVLWGTENSGLVNPLVEDFNQKNPSFAVKYVQKSSENFNQDLLEALASNTGPDLIFLSNDLAFYYADKIFNIPYTSYPLSSFKNNFAGAGEVFLNSGGVLAFPMSIDPLVMYYNRTILDDNEIVYPPKTWNELVNIIPKLNQKYNLGQLKKSTVALGHFSNIVHAKEIISMLFMQLGNPIVSERSQPNATESGGKFVSTLSNSNLDSILKFYTDFADPSKSIYSWNRSFSNSRDEFSAENLIFYFGYASEVKSLINKNPNQNFLVAPIPQIKNSKFKSTFARVTGLSVLSSSKNFRSAFSVAGLMASSDFSTKFALAQGKVPPRRDALAIQQNDAYFPTFYASALFARSYLDPSPKDTNDIFRRMVDGVISNRNSVGQALQNAHNELNLLLFR